MPYIKPEYRPEIDKRITELVAYTQQPGELNYAITKLCHEYLCNSLCYGTLNAVIGVLECAKLELYRMVAAPYEDKKRDENGPVSKLDANN